MKPKRIQITTFLGGEKWNVVDGTTYDVIEPPKGRKGVWIKPDSPYNKPLQLLHREYRVVEWFKPEPAL